MKTLLVWGITLILCAPFVGQAKAEDPTYSVKNGKFVTTEGEIPSACLGQLKIDLNGDDTVAAIYLNRTTLRGCIDANIPYPGGDETQISYEIIENLGNDTFKLKVYEAVNGSMGASCSRIVVQFSNREYLTRKGEKTVLSLEKLGEW